MFNCCIWYLFIFLMKLNCIRVSQLRMSQLRDWYMYWWWSAACSCIAFGVRGSLVRLFKILEFCAVMFLIWDTHSYTLHTSLWTSRLNLWYIIIHSSVFIIIYSLLFIIIHHHSFIIIHYHSFINIIHNSSSFIHHHSSPVRFKPTFAIESEITCRKKTRTLLKFERYNI